MAKKTNSTIIKVDRFNDPDLIKGIKFDKDVEIQISIGNKKMLVIKSGIVTVM